MNENGLPVWLESLIRIAGISIGVFLFIRLIEELFDNGIEQDKRPRVFISHSWKYDTEFNNLITRFEDYGFSFYNHSVPSSKPINASSKSKLIAEIESKMKNCSKFVVIAGMYVNTSDIIKEEIRIAKKLKKEIIAIRPHGALVVPKIIRENADKIIGTNAPSLIRKLKK